MLGFMLAELSDANGVGWEIRTAGTHAVEGQAISQRTLEAMEKLDELGAHNYRAHRSHQLADDDVTWADVIVAVEADHVAYLKARYPSEAHKAVQLRAFCLHAPLDEPFDVQVAVVASIGPDDTLDVADPAGGEQSDYDECARELWDMAQVFAALVNGDEGL